MIPFQLPLSVRTLALVLFVYKHHSSSGRHTCQSVADALIARSQETHHHEVVRYLKDLNANLDKLDDRLHLFHDIKTIGGMLGISEQLDSSHELLLVAGKLLARVALLLESDINRELIRSIDWEEIGWPPNDIRRFENDANPFDEICRIKLPWQTPHSQPLATRKAILIEKLSDESLNLEKRLHKTVREFYAFVHSLPAQSIRDGPKRHDRTVEAVARIEWDDSLHESLKAAELRELQAIERDLTNIKELQDHFAGEMGRQAEPLDACEDFCARTTDLTAETTLQLVDAARTQSRAWVWEGGAFGAVLGAIAGIIGGPPGLLIGGSLGGALGSASGRALRIRQKTQLERVRQQCLRGRVETQETGRRETQEMGRGETGRVEAVRRVRRDLAVGGLPMMLGRLKF